MTNPVQATELAILQAAAASVPPDVRKLIQREALASQKNLQPWDYYSTVRFRGVRAGAGPYTFTTDTSQRLAFAYKRGDSLESAGYAPGTTAKLNHTNLVSGGSQTNDNSTFVINGMSILPLPGSEPRLVAALMRQVFATISLSATNTQILGGIDQYPGAGGLYGVGRTQLVSAVTAGGASFGPEEGYLSNGNPMRSNQMRLGQFPLKWNATGSGESDTSLIITLTPAEAIVLDGEATAGDFVAPAEIFADFKVKLAGWQYGGRSNNS